jgi:hypothetical protein
MIKTVKSAAKIGIGVFALTALASAAAGYFFARRRNGSDYRYDYDTSDKDEEGEVGSSSSYAMNRKQAFKNMVRAGKDMKDAWNRIQRDAKIIAKETASVASDLTGSDDDS